MGKQLIWLPVVLVACALGCAREAQQRHKPSPSAETSVPLPEWAPKHPSPEFLRAAKVLKPLPPEPTDTGDESTIGMAVLLVRLRKTWVSAYEFFGSLSDEQIQRLLKTKQEVRIPVKSPTSAQRRALDKWFEAYREAMKGATRGFPVPDDYLVHLYRSGAAEDLANVDVGFATTPVGPSSSSVMSTHRVHLWFWVRRREGGVEQFGYGIAQM